MRRRVTVVCVSVFVCLSVNLWSVCSSFSCTPSTALLLSIQRMVRGISLKEPHTPVSEKGLAGCCNNRWLGGKIMVSNTSQAFCCSTGWQTHSFDFTNWVNYTVALCKRNYFKGFKFMKLVEANLSTSGIWASRVDTELAKVLISSACR